MKGFPVLSYAAGAALLLTLACGGERAASSAAETASPDPNAAAQGGGAQASPSENAAASKTAPALPDDPNATVATVNGAKITGQELEMAVKAVSRSSKVPAGLTPEQTEQMRRTVLDGLIDRELLYQKAQADGLKADPNEVDSVMTKAHAAFPSEASWTDNLKKQGLPDEAAFQDLVTRTLMIEELVKKETGGGEVTDAEAKKYYDDHPDEMKKSEKVRASHILFRVPKGATDAEKSAAKAKAEKALADLKAGGDFATIAKQRSEDPVSAPSGGDLGYFGKGRMVPAFEKVAFSLKVGQTSDVFESPYGYHIMKITDKQEARQATFDEVRDNLKSFLQQKKAREAVQALLEKLHKTAEIDKF